MRSKLLCAGILALFLPVLAVSASAQASYAARQPVPRFAVGGGLSTFDMDWGGGRRMLGITGWGDWNPPFIPGFLHGVSLEVEIRDLRWAHGSLPAQLHSDVYGGGVLYHVPYRIRKLPHLAPYIKGMGYFGTLDFPPLAVAFKPDGTTVEYTHDSRTVGALGGGLDYRLTHGITARFDYEYTAWPHLFAGQHTLDQNGYTFGALYTFGGRYR